MNALAAAAVGITFGVPGRAIVEALSGFRAADRRMEVEAAGGVNIINDTYNANADSTIAALETLAAVQTGGKRIAVLGDMLELGAREVSEHRRVGKAVSRLGIDYLLTYGERSRRIGETAGSTPTIHFEEKNILAEYLAELATPGDLILLKGSRGMGMDDIAVFLQHRLRGGAGNPA
jgi:UDP-N-acetylmuramoyl-tripeptide--D-alanyl-D-alanine ligase